MLAFNTGALTVFEFSTISLSSTSNVETLNVTVFPSTNKLPEIVRSLVISVLPTT